MRMTAQNYSRRRKELYSLNADTSKKLPGISTKSEDPMRVSLRWRYILEVLLINKNQKKVSEYLFPLYAKHLDAVDTLFSTSNIAYLLLLREF